MIAQIYSLRGEFIGSVNRLNVQFRVVPDQIRIRLLQTSWTLYFKNTMVQVQHSSVYNSLHFVYVKSAFNLAERCERLERPIHCLIKQP